MSMKRLGRRGRILKWGGVVVSLLIVVAWAVSPRWGFSYEGRVSAKCRWYISLENACVTGSVAVCDRQPPGIQLGWLVFQRLRSPRLWIPRYRDISGKTPWTNSPYRYRSVHVPLWIPFLLFAMPTVFLWWLDRRRIPPGHCQKCGYNLTGNVSGVCPECGETI